MRPTTYNEEVLADAHYYVDHFDEECFNEEVIPTVVGLCRYIRRARSTVYAWASEEGKEEFSDIVKELEEYQHIKLVNGGLTNKYNPMIAKLILGRHGYTDKVELDDKPKSVPKNFNAFYDEE